MTQEWGPADLLLLPILLALVYGVLIPLTYIMRKYCRVPKEKFDAPERMLAWIAWPFSRRAQQWLREHPERPHRDSA